MDPVNGMCSILTLRHLPQCAATAAQVASSPAGSPPARLDVPLPTVQLRIRRRDDWCCVDPRGNVRSTATLRAGTINRPEAPRTCLEVPVRSRTAVAALRHAGGCA